MICPVCKTHQPDNPDIESCVQCASDLQVHRLLEALRTKIQMKHKKGTISKLNTGHLQQQSVYWLQAHWIKMVPALMSVVCTLFLIFVGIRVLLFLDRTQSHHTEIANTKKDTDFLHHINNLISQKKFNEVVNILKVKNDLTNEEKYLYGYALMCLKKNMEALVIWWPLANKGNTKLQNDCILLATPLLEPQNFEKLMSTGIFNEDRIKTLFLIARHINSRSPVYGRLRQLFFESLWQKKDWESLERLLKSTKEELSGIQLENLSKIAFFQAKHKLSHNIPSFIHLVLSGGASLIMRHSVYHAEIDREMEFLGLEIKNVFDVFISQNERRFVWSKIVFESFIDYETKILTEVLQFSLKHPYSKEIIPSPGFLLLFDHSAHLSSHFLPWLAGIHKDIFQMYHADFHSAVLFCFSGESSGVLTSNNFEKFIQKNQFHPYLRLALMLRSSILENFSNEELVQIGEFDGLKNDFVLFRNIAVQTAIIIIQENQTINKKEIFWNILFDFFPALRDPELKNLMIKNIVHEMGQKYEMEKKLNFYEIQTLAKKIEAHDLEKDMNFLHLRTQDCTQFLNALNDPKKEISVITKSIKNESALREHFSLIADAFFLCPSECNRSEKFFDHIENIVENKKVNKLIQIKKLLEFDELRDSLECECKDCLKEFYTSLFSKMPRILHLSVVKLPDLNSYTYTEHNKNKNQISILSKQDPFQTLGVSIEDTKAEIMQKVFQLIQKFPEKMPLFRQCQNDIFSPAQRFIHHYFRYFSHAN